MMHWRYLLFALAFLAACNPDKESKVRRDKLDFSMSEESELFFKNLRQSYYDLQDMEAAGMKVFRFSDRSIAEDHPVINLAIVMQWRLDEATIFVEPNAFLQEAEQINIHWQNDSTSGDLTYLQGDREVQQAFVIEVYDHLVSGDSMHIKVQDSTFAFPANKEEREAFRITTFDYLRLVGVF